MQASFGENTGEIEDSKGLSNRQVKMPIFTALEQHGGTGVYSKAHKYNKSQERKEYVADLELKTVGIGKEVVRLTKNGHVHNALELSPVHVPDQ